MFWSGSLWGFFKLIYKIIGFLWKTSDSILWRNTGYPHQNATCSHFISSKSGNFSQKRLYQIWYIFKIPFSSYIQIHRARLFLFLFHSKFHGAFPDIISPSRQDNRLFAWHGPLLQISVHFQGTDLPPHWWCIHSTVWSDEKSIWRT